MIFGYIILGIALLLFLTLSFPIYVHISYREELKIMIKYLFFTFPVFPRQEKKEQSKKREKKTEGKDKKKEQAEKDEVPWWKQLYREKGFSGLLHFLSGIGKIVQSTAKKVLRHTLIKNLELIVTVGGEDSAAAAVDYGKICSVVYPVSALLLQCCRHQKAQVSVQPDFQSPKSAGKLYLVLRFRGFWLLTAGVGALFRLIRLQAVQSKENEALGQKAA